MEQFVDCESAAISAHSRKPVERLTVLHHFSERSRDSAERVAVKGAHGSCTFGQLDEWSDRVASGLIESGVRSGSVVGICAEVFAEVPACILGILKAGAAFLPIDPRLPEKRQAFVALDAGISCAIWPKGSAAHLPDEVKLLDADTLLRSAESKAGELPLAKPSFPAYVIYTSGTTGQPKGCIVSHGNLESYVAWARQVYDRGDQICFALYSTLSFDLTITSVFLPLIAGGCIKIFPNDGSGTVLGEIFSDPEVDIAKVTPSHLRLLGEMSLARIALKRLIVGGEAFPASLARQIAQKSDHPLEIYNEYGPTEATVGCMLYKYRGDETGDLPIGRASDNARLFVLNDELQEIGPGQEGELYVGGECVTVGYAGQPELTAARFLPDPLRPGARIYRTGDAVRWRHDGEMEFLGRVDRQVKVRGHRIELTEVELALAGRNEIASAVAFVSGQGSRQGLCAACTRKKRYRLRNGAVLDHANSDETEYMYEDIFVERSYFRGGIRLPAAACVIDVGANIGMFSLFISRCSPGSRVYAFEPIPENFQKLQRNLAHTPAAKVYCCAIGGAEQTAEFDFFEGSTMMSCRSDLVALERDRELVRHYSLGRNGDLPLEETLDHRFRRRAVRCPIRPLSSIFCEESIGWVDLLKVDAQGAEFDVLAGINDSDWNKIAQIVIEIHGNDGSDGLIKARKTEEIFLAKGYECVIDQDRDLQGSGHFLVFARRPDYVAADLQKDFAETQILAGEELKPDFAAIKEQLKLALPFHAVPDVIFGVDTIPTTLNGKLDMQALERIAAEWRHCSASPAPADAFEEHLLAIWRRVLAKETLGPTDSFLDAGGQSLLAIRLVTQIRKAMDLKAPIALLLQGASVRRLAQWFREQGQGPT